MTKFGILAAAAVLASTLAGPAMAQEVIYNPGYCAQFYPNANCQNMGPGNPYTGSYQRQVYRGSGLSGPGLSGSHWQNSYNRWDDDSGISPGDVAAGVVGGAVGTAAAIATVRSAARNMPAATASSASPAPGSAARTAGCTSASRQTKSERKRRPEWPPFLPFDRAKAGVEVLALCGQVWYSSRRRSDPCGGIRRSPITSIRRFSSAVEQRFCKPKVGSSILSTGTSICGISRLKCSPAFYRPWGQQRCRDTQGCIRPH